jgi:hypothetical protein
VHQAALILTLRSSWRRAHCLDRRQKQEKSGVSNPNPAQVMRFADGYVDAVSRASARAQSEAIDSRLRYRLMDFQIKQATAAVQIAAGPNPSINAVDMVVLASLTRKSAAHNLPEIMGSKAQAIIEAFARLENDAWPLVDFLSQHKRRICAGASPPGPQMPPRWTASHSTDWRTSRRPVAYRLTSRAPQ